MEGFFVMLAVKGLVWKRQSFQTMLSQAVKHASGKICFEMKEAREKDIAESLDNEIRPKGQDLTMARRVWRSKWWVLCEGRRSV